MNSVTKQDKSIAWAYFGTLLFFASVISFFASPLGIVLMFLIAIAFFIFHLLWVFDKINLKGSPIMAAWIVAASLILVIGAATSKLDNKVPTSYPITNGTQTR